MTLLQQTQMETKSSTLLTVDEHGAESDWGTLEVAMPVNQPHSQPSSQQSLIPLFFQILQRLMNTR